MLSFWLRLRLLSLFTLLVVISTDVLATSHEVFVGRITFDTPSPREVIITVDELGSTPPTTAILTYRTDADVEPLYGTFESGTILYTGTSIMISASDLPKAIVLSMRSGPSTSGHRPSESGAPGQNDDAINFDNGVALSYSREPMAAAGKHPERSSRVTTQSHACTPTCGCMSGGYPATECSITVYQISCSVSCPEGYYACCGAGDQDCGTNPGCNCLPNPTGCSGGGGGGGW